MSEPTQDEQEQEILLALGKRFMNERYDAVVALKERWQLEALLSLPPIKDGQYYFVSGKDLDKAIAQLQPNTEGGDAKDAPLH